MSLFDKDLVERSIDYSDDPAENMARQIARALIRFSQTASEWPSYIDSMNYVMDGIGDFMQDLLSEHIPEGFLGPFEKINTYRVTLTQDEIPIIKVVYRFADINKYKENKEIQFTAGLPPISKV